MALCTWCYSLTDTLHKYGKLFMLDFIVDKYTFFQQERRETSAQIFT